LLKKHRHLPSKFLDGKAAQIHAVDIDRTAFRIVKAAKELQQGALPRPIRSNDSHEAPRRDRQTEITKSDAACSGIAKRHVLKMNSFAKLWGRRHRLFRGHHARAYRKKLEQTAEK